MLGRAYNYYYYYIINNIINNEAQFLPSSGRAYTAVWMHYMDDNKTYGEIAWRQLHKNAASNIEQVRLEAPHKTAVVRPPTTHHENYQD